MIRHLKERSLLFVNQEKSYWNSDGCLEIGCFLETTKTGETAGDSLDRGKQESFLQMSYFLSGAIFPNQFVEVKQSCYFAFTTFDTVDICS